MRRGFTLVEMMFVVAIIGVLTTLAVWGFSRPLVATRGIEASTFLLQVRTKQFHDLNQVGQFNGTLEAQSWPREVPHEKRVHWGLPDNAWAALPKPAMPTWFRYTVIAGGPNDPPPADAPIYERGKPWFWAYARGDADGDGKYSYFEITSERATVYSENETE